MIMRTSMSWILFFVLALSLCSADVFALDAGGDDPPPATTDDPPPSLDDLLGLDEEEDEDDQDAQDQVAEEELQRELNEEDIANAFLEALEQMKVSATQLDQAFDPGLSTQRVQQDIISKLDMLIEQAAQQSNNSSSSSSSSQQQQQQQNPGMQQQQQQQQNQENQASDNPDSSNSQDGDPPPQQDGDLNSVIDETRSEWGNLPDRVRDMLLQGRREKYSSLYERLTREYYRRLAEEGTR